MSSHIGLRIKQLREAQNLTITELSARTAIGEQNISQIENGEIDPSAATLIKLTRALGVRLGTLLDGEESSSPVVVTRQQDTPSVKTIAEGEATPTNLNFYSLAKGKCDRHMEPFIINVMRVDTDDKNRSSHEGEEMVYVLSGEVELHYGTECHTLKEGESIYYDSIISHRLTSTTDSPAKVLAVIYVPF